MAFGFNWKPQQIPTQMKGAQFAPQKVGLDQDFPSLINGAIGRSPEEIAVEQNLNERQVGNANDMANWIQQGGTPQANAAAAAEKQAQDEAVVKQQRIKEIEAEIAEIEQRIAERKRGMSANEDALNTELAAIEARKINQKDPTAIWRWKAGMDAQKTQRAEDLARIEAEKQKTEKRNKELNQYKIESILKSTMPSNARTRDELTMMDKNLNDAEELAKQYGDTEMLKRIDNRRQALRDHVPVSEKANEIESDFIKEMSMVGKVGGRTKAQFVEYVTDILEKNPDVWRYNPALQQKLYQAIGTNTKNTPRPTLPQET